MTFSIPSPVELTQLKIQYQRNVGTPRASKRIELGATAPEPGSTSSASTFLSVTSERLREPSRTSRGSCLGVGVARSPTGPLHPRRDRLAVTRPVSGSRATRSPVPPARPRALAQGVVQRWVDMRPYIPAL